MIVSGGALVRSWTSRFQALLCRARRIVIVGETEHSADAQRRTDAGHAAQAREIAALTGLSVERWTPPRDKDLAALHERRQTAAQEAEHAEVAARPGPDW